MVDSQGSFKNPPLRILKLTWEFGIGWLVIRFCQRLLAQQRLNVTLRTNISKPHSKKPCVAAAAMMIVNAGPLGFLLGLPFAFLSLILSIIGVFVWIFGLLLSCTCPCCFCVTIMVEFALGLIKAPILVMKWFTSKIPC
ncbi:PROTEIN putative-RELATED [Salix koriyanagi]|uniref:PROTEIN putative-RELATED n=1 Tax=Salix koriyanagi TaxID=2511006 RepID=A0A9Q0UXD4_9ROSI|nr:PROTEIN putative-RELATED [Salix koriyanagi]